MAYVIGQANHLISDASVSSLVIGSDDKLAYIYITDIPVNTGTFISVMDISDLRNPKEILYKQMEYALNILSGTDIFLFEENGDIYVRSTASIPDDPPETRYTQRIKPAEGEKRVDFDGYQYIVSSLSSLNGTFVADYHGVYHLNLTSLKYKIVRNFTKSLNAVLTLAQSQDGSILFHGRGHCHLCHKHRQ